MPVTVQSNGLIKAQAEKTPLFAPTQGKIVFIRMRENLPVQQGDTLLMIENEVLQKNIATQKNKEQEYHKLMSDARALCQMNNGLPFAEGLSLQTPFYVQSIKSLQDQYIQQQDRVRLLEKKFVRIKALRDEKLISANEYETLEQELSQNQKDLPLLLEKAKNQWQQELLNYESQLREASGNKQQSEKQLLQYVLKAPVSGTLHNYSGVLINTFVSGGQSIAEISPESDKMIECYVLPSHIGLLKKDMEVSFQIESFNYNQWGFLKGRIIDISNDVTIQQNNNSTVNNNLFLKCVAQWIKTF